MSEWHRKNARVENYFRKKARNGIPLGLIMVVRAFAFNDLDDFRQVRLHSPIQGQVSIPRPRIRNKIHPNIHPCKIWSHADTLFRDPDSRFFLSVHPF
jgi:hypothetical protein